MRVLAVGSGGKEFAKGLFEGKEATFEEVEMKPRHKHEGEFDCVIIFNVFNVVSYREIQSYLKLWLGALKPGGEMLIFVPSLEWAAKQILFADKPSPALQVHLFGSQTGGQAYKGAYTLLQVRDLCQQAGLKVTHVNTGIYDIAGHEADMHSLRGLK